MLSQEEKRKHSHFPGFSARNLLLIPNLLTLSRLALLVPALVFIIGSDSPESDHIAAAFLLVAFATDVIDGLWARVFKCISDLGKVLDPVVDKIVVDSCALALCLSHNNHTFPIYLVIVIVVRDLLILVLALRVLREDHHLFVSSWTGKVTTFTIAITILAFLLRDHMPVALLIVLPTIILGMIAVSSVDYLETYWSVRHKRIKRGSDDEATI